MTTAKAEKEKAAPADGQQALVEVPLRFGDVRAQLLEPFYTKDVYVRPGAVSKKKPYARALFYIKSQAIEDRLDEIVGSVNWVAHYEPWGTTRLVGRLTILDATKESTGEGGDDDDDNCGTIAEAQVFKRLFSKFGFRMFYRMPEKWGLYDKDESRFFNSDRLIIEIYMVMGLKKYISPETVEAAKKKEAELKSDGSGKEQGNNGNSSTSAPQASATERGTAPKMAEPNQVTMLRERGLEEQLLKRYRITSLAQLTFQQAANELTKSQNGSQNGYRATGTNR
jgi:hypothetical protein